MDSLNLFRAARRASAPLLAIRTPDPAQTERGIIDAYPQDPVLSWDICRGCQWLNQAGFAVAWRLLLDKGEYEPAPKTAEELEAVRDELMLKTANLPELLGQANRFPGAAFCSSKTHSSTFAGRMSSRRSGTCATPSRRTAGRWSCSARPA